MPPSFQFGREWTGQAPDIWSPLAFTPQQLDQLAHLLRPRVAMPDERLIAAGERGDQMYFISSGVVQATAGGQRFLLTRGDCFGEMALVLDVPRQARP